MTTTTNTNNTATIKKISIDNGMCRSNTGYRRIVFAPGGTCRPVINAVRSGYQPERHTVQTARPGDIILIANVYQKGLVLTAQTVTDNEYNGDILASYRHDAHPDKAFRSFPETLENFRFFLNAIQLEVGEEEAKLSFEFLKDVYGRGPSFLPEGLGWDGKRTLGDINKKKRLERFFEGLLPKGVMKRLVEKALISPREGLPTDWHAETVGRLPNTLEAPAKSWDGSVVNIESYTGWILIDKKGRAQYIEPSPTSGEWGSNYAHSECGEYSSIPEIMPNGIVKAIKITWGGYTKDHCSYGVKWELFKISSTNWIGSIPSISGRLEPGMEVFFDGGFLFSLSDMRTKSPEYQIGWRGVISGEGSSDKIYYRYDIFI